MQLPLFAAWYRGLDGRSLGIVTCLLPNLPWSFYHVVDKFNLPGRFSYAGDLALVGKLTEADTADTVLAEICMRTSADLTSVVLTGGELLGTLLL